MCWNKVKMDYEDSELYFERAKIWILSYILKEQKYVVKEDD
jgi:hypothetical protein